MAEDDPTASTWSGLDDLLRVFHRAPWGDVLPGMALACVARGEPPLLRGFGFACVANQRCVDAETIFRVGSITKLVTATALMQLWDASALDLDVPIIGYLAPRLRRDLPAGFDSATLRHLLTHRSGLPREAPGDYFTTLSFPDIDELVGGLAETSLLFTPGTSVEYSNVGYALLGHVIGEVSGRPYREYVEERVLRPLGMESSGFEVRNRDPDRLAVGYLREMQGRPSVPAPDPDLGAFDAAGQLYSTAADLARFIDFQLGASSAVLSLATLYEMQVEEAGAGRGPLGWNEQVLAGRQMLGHDGQTFGWAADLRIIPDRGVGVAALTNVRMNAMDLTGRLVELLARHD